MARSSSRLPKRFPVGSKYVVEGYGSLVRRHVEFPNGRKITLAPRKASVCTCGLIHEVSVVPQPEGQRQDFTSRTLVDVGCQRVDIQYR